MAYWDWMIRPKGPLAIRSLLDTPFQVRLTMSKKKAEKVLNDHKLRLRKIISGGQFGADLAGLWVGRKLGLKTGGFAPKGYRTERGPRVELLRGYGLEEDGVERYDSRTRKNVEAADLTLLFGNAASGGSKLTVNACQSIGRPVYNFPFDGSDTKEVGVLIRALLIQHRVRTLNVAGNRESITPGINAYTRECLMEAIEEILRAQQ